MKPRLPLLHRAVLCAILASTSAGMAHAKPTQSAGSKKTDAQVRQLLIDESIAAYPGNCPCPYNSMRNGRSCGRRSAWNKPGGYAPLCYADDVTDEQVAQWRQEHTKR